MTVLWREHFAALAGLLPWWAWAMLVVAAFFAFNAAWVSAVSVTSAAGAHHLQLSRRQRRMAAWWARLSWLAVPASFAIGALALAAAGYRLWIGG